MRTYVRGNYAGDSARDALKRITAPEDVAVSMLAKSDSSKFLPLAFNGRNISEDAWKVDSTTFAKNLPVPLLPLKGVAFNVGSTLKHNSKEPSRLML